MFTINININNNNNNNNKYTSPGKMSNLPTNNKPGIISVSCSEKQMTNSALFDCLPTIHKRVK